MRPKCSPAERFWSKVDIRGPEDCWPWTASKLPRGYGQIYHSGLRRPVAAQRMAWELTRGAIPPGLGVLHSCDNPPCVNPAHLWIGTDADNHADMVAKGRNSCNPRVGTENVRAKL